MIFNKLLNRKYKKCKICKKSLISNGVQPAIKIKNYYDFDNNSDYFFIFFCKRCWDNLSVKERINFYLKKINPKYHEYVIKDICRKSNVKSDKYIRKIKLNKIKNRKTL